MSLFWTVWFPLLLMGVIFYGYNSGGFIGEWIQGLVDPLLWLGSTILNIIFGVFEARSVPGR